MRRNSRGMYEDTDNYKVVLLVAGGILLVAVITFFVVYGIYSNKVSSSEIAKTNDESSKIDVSRYNTNTTSVSSSIGKDINEVKDTTEENILSNNDTDNANIIVIDNEQSNNQNQSSVGSVAEINDNQASQTTEPTAATQEPVQEPGAETASDSAQEPTEQEEKEPSFKNPIENGTVMREFAKENLVYSDTLEEWITHVGLDIKADKTTVVKAAEAGTVESIKNDPRYGLTVIIKHAKDYKTVYSNLLTTEFVNVGDKVEVGQSIGTVGNSAAFEIADEPHLHFEIVKAGEKVDPSLYIK